MSYTDRLSFQGLVNEHDNQIRKWCYRKQTHTHTYTKYMYKQNTNQQVPCLLHTLNKNVLTQECLKTIIYLLSEESLQQIQLLE